MQTITLDPNSSAKVAHRGRPQLQSIAATHPGILPGTLPGSLPGSMLPGLGTGPSAHAAIPATHSYADTDSMLGEESDFGAIRGLRIALLFNAGLALSGLLAYEIWNFIAG